MSSPFDEAEYLPLPALSPYTSHDRYDRPPKEIFKAVEAALRRATEPDRTYRYADIACANGEMLYYLRQQFPQWEFSGYDLTPAFIETGRRFPGLAGVPLHVADLFEMETTFEIVSCINIMTAIWDPAPFLDKLLSLVEPGGLLLVDGCFNKHDVEVRTVFMDNSKPEAAGRWRRDGSQHSRSGVAALLEGRCASFVFEDVPMSVEIPRRPEAPATDVWTFRDAKGRNRITNGANILMDKSLLVVKSPQ